MKSLSPAILIMLGAATAAKANPHDVEGLWLTQAQDGHVEIADCGDGTPCGTLVWVDTETTDTPLDARNQDETLRGRPLIGVPIVWGFERGSKRWKSGQVYNPEDGKTFRATMERMEDGTLEVKGCLGPFCRTNIWTPLEPAAVKAEH